MLWTATRKTMTNAARWIGNGASASRAPTPAIAAAAAVGDRVAKRPPEREDEQRENDDRERDPHLDGEVEDEVVGVIEELGRPAPETPSASTRS
jgi:hypothetical protein